MPAPLAGADPRALVAVLSAAAVEPPTAGIRVCDRLGVLVATDNREAVEIATSAAVDEWSDRRIRVPPSRWTAVTPAAVAIAGRVSSLNQISVTFLAVSVVKVW